MHLARGDDSNLTSERSHRLGLTDIICAKMKRTRQPKTQRPRTLGMGWPVERTKSWFSNFGQLQRKADRFPEQRRGQLALALILVVKFVKWARGWTD